MDVVHITLIKSTRLAMLAMVWIEKLAKVTIEVKNVIDSALSETGRKSDFRGLLVLFVLPKDHILP